MVFLLRIELFGCYLFLKNGFVGKIVVIGGCREYIGVLYFVVILVLKMVS